MSTTIETEGVAELIREGLDFGVVPIVATSGELEAERAVVLSDFGDEWGRYSEQRSEQGLMVRNLQLRRCKTILSVNSLHLTSASAGQRGPDSDATGFKTCVFPKVFKGFDSARMS
jgi:hypothetical protein